MGLSSNSIIHFTNKKENLRGILQDNFKIKYCLESLELGAKAIKLRAPIVSFCDIPLSEIKKHMESYGSYGIGLTKEWAQRNQLNPVLYIEKNSHLANSYYTSINEHIIARLSGGGLSDGQKALADVIRYFKHYQGPLVRKGSVIESYRFSDEREWRYVPPYQTECLMIVNDDSYQLEKEHIDSKIQSLRLKFEPNDIKYIIISCDSEIPEFLTILREAKGPKFTYADVDRLTTRILTAEQINTDF
jgi:hypothetical protein